MFVGLEWRCSGAWGPQDFSKKTFPVGGAGDSVSRMTINRGIGLVLETHLTTLLAESPDPPSA